MGNLSYALVVVLCLNVVMYIGSLAILEVSEGSVSTGFNCADSVLGSLGNNGCLDNTINSSLVYTAFPDAESSLDASTGDVFTDIFNAVKSWLLDTLGLKYVFDIVTSPAKILSLSGLPTGIVFALGGLWYGFTLFLIIDWIKGGNA